MYWYVGLVFEGRFFETQQFQSIQPKAYTLEVSENKELFKEKAIQKKLNKNFSRTQ